MFRCSSLRTTALCAGAVLAAAHTLYAQQLQPHMGQPLAGLSPDQLMRFELGLEQFNHSFEAVDGLGPILNQTSCASCHNNPIGGSGSITVQRFGILDEKSGTFDSLDDLGGSLLQSQAIDVACLESIPAEANVVTFRATPSALGFGLLEAIPDDELLALANDPPSNEVSGRAHMVSLLEDPEGPLRVGRFGWKAQVATVMTFSGDASQNEMGITNDLLPEENAPNGDADLLALCDTVPDPEDTGVIGERFIDRITDFQRFLAAPPQTPPSGMTGEGLFAAIGCTDCHIPSYTLPDDPGLEEAIRGKTIKPYSDFLLHDMGLLFDGIVQGDAQAGEIRTPALWGLRIRDPMLHDASAIGGVFADRVLQAIADHGQAGSEAQPSVNRFFNDLTGDERDAVVAFLDSLGRAEFDHDGDNDIDQKDGIAFEACFNGPQGYTPDDACAISDIDRDGDVDCLDHSFLVLAWTDMVNDPPVPGACAVGCASVADCADTNSDGLRDDGCVWWQCVNNACDRRDIVFADLGGQFGDCVPDGTPDNNDRNLALNCFSNVDTSGTPGAFPCEPHAGYPPVAYNVDAGGQFGDCAPDGVCDGNDAFLALNAFAGTTPCTCPANPEPGFDAGPQVVAKTTLSLVAERRTVRPGNQFDVDVFVDTPLPALRGYQLHIDVSGGRRGTLEIVDLAVAPVRDHVFVHEPFWQAFNLDTRQMVVGLDGAGVPTRAGGYLATLTLRATPNASGTFLVDLRVADDSRDHRTFLFPTAPRGKIAIGGTTPARIAVAELRTGGVRAAR